MADREAGRVISAPLLGWRDIEIGPPVAKATGLPVVVESAGKACALAHMWLSHDDVMNTQDFMYITISDGVGTGLVIDGRLVSGHGGTAGEFGHMAINLDGPRCACGSNGCWMAYISDRATSSRYASYIHAKSPASPPSLRTIIIACALRRRESDGGIASDGPLLGVGPGKHSSWRGSGMRLYRRRNYDGVGYRRTGNARSDRRARSHRKSRECGDPSV